MSHSRRHFGNEVKAQVVRRHLAGKEPVSKLAEEFGVQPSQIHTWVNLVLAQAEHAFERSAGHRNGRGCFSLSAAVCGTGENTDLPVHFFVDTTVRIFSRDRRTLAFQNRCQPHPTELGIIVFIVRLNDLNFRDNGTPIHQYNRLNAPWYAGRPALTKLHLKPDLPIPNITTKLL